MTLLDKLGLGGMTALFGIVFVFLLLVILIAVMVLLGKVCTRIVEPLSNKMAARREQRAAKRLEKKKQQALAAQSKKSEANAEQTQKPVKAPEPAPVAVQDDLELIAVLTAAAAAMMETSPKRVRVTSVKKTAQRSAWARAGRQEQLASRI